MQRHRASDPEDFDATPLRRGGVDVGYGHMRLRLFGPEGLVVTLIGCLVAAFIWQTWDRRDEHATIVRGLDVNSCVLTLTPDERVALRGRLAPKTLGDFCPWLQVQEPRP